MDRKEKIIVNSDDTLINYLSLVKNDWSKKKIKQYIKYDMVMVNGTVVTNANFMVKKSDLIEIYYDRKVINEFNLEILYEDKDIIVINKPCGLLSIANDKEKEVTAFRMVRDYVKSINPKLFLFVIHRLDKETSGVLMFAKNEKAKLLFQDNWNKIVKKRLYMAVVEGNINDSGVLHTFLKESKSGLVYSSRDNSGKEAITEYKVIKRGRRKTLLEVNILTGRRNQIRVHLSENNNPIIGDSKYGSSVKSRLMLHARVLELLDPRTNKILRIEAKVPTEFYDVE